MRRDIETKAKTWVCLYSLGFILGMLAHIMTTCKLIMHRKEFLTHVQVYKLQQSIKGARRRYFNSTEILQCKGNLNSPNCVYDLTRSLGQHRIFHFKYSADCKGIALKPQWNLEESSCNSHHFRKHYEYFASKLLLISQHFLT